MSMGLPNYKNVALLYSTFVFFALNPRIQIYRHSVSEDFDLLYREYYVCSKSLIYRWNENKPQISELSVFAIILKYAELPCIDSLLVLYQRKYMVKLGNRRILRRKMSPYTLFELSCSSREICWLLLLYISSVGGVGGRTGFFRNSYKLKSQNG
jgi:hypothetical protein